MTALLLFLIFVVLILPDPVRAGAFTGDVIQSMLTFARSIGIEVTVYDADGSDGDGFDSEVDEGRSQVRIPPEGGIVTGDGTIAASSGSSSPMSGLESTVADSAHVATERITPLPPAVPRWIRIPAIGVDAELVELGLQTDAAMEVPETARLAGWYRFGPTPGQLGPAVLTGHADWKHEIGVFHDLGKLREGNELTIGRSDGTGAVFRVARVVQYPKSLFPSREVYGDTDHAALRIITCGGSLDRDADGYRDNVIVFATLIGSVDVPM
jgi:Sortase domain